MIILDTDHFTVLRYADDSRYPILTEKLLTSEDQRIVTTVVTVEEQMRGWLAEINRWRDIRRQRLAYDRLAMLVEFLSDWETLRIDDQAIEQFNAFASAASSHWKSGSQNRSNRSGSKCIASIGELTRLSARARVESGELARVASCHSSSTRQRGPAETAPS